MNEELERRRSPCYEKAVELLTRRPHFRQELSRKLADRGYSEEEIRQAIDRLTGQGYLDDLRSARGFVESRLKRGPVGRRRLAADLKRRGAPADVVDQALATCTPTDDLGLAREAALLWSGRLGKDTRALARHLDRKGFSQRAILSILREVSEADESSPFFGLKSSP